MSGNAWAMGQRELGKSKSNRANKQLHIKLSNRAKRKKNIHDYFTAAARQARQKGKLEKNGEASAGVEANLSQSISVDNAYYLLQ